MITKKSSYLILLALLLFPIVIIADEECPIIFVHGIQGQATPASGWPTWNSTMMKILNSGYGGYIEGIPLNCDKSTTLHPSFYKKSIYNFSYYNPDGSRGVIGSNGIYEPEPTPAYDPWPENYFRDEYRISASNACWAQHLADFIQKVRIATGADKVDIVAHSMGGLVSRAAITYYGCENKVRKLLTVGTPNLGINEWSILETIAECLNYQEWQDVGSCSEMAIGFADFVLISNPSIEKTYCEFLLDNDPQIQTACIGGNKVGKHWFLALFGSSDGATPVYSAHLPYAEFNPLIYATHSRDWTDMGDEFAITTCAYTIEFIKKWIIDDDDTYTSAEISGEPHVIYNRPYWPNTDDKYCGSIRISIPVTDYRDVRNVVTEVYGNSRSSYDFWMQNHDPIMARGSLISSKSIPLYKCPQSGMGQYVSVVLEPGMFGGFYVYTVGLRINDMENGQVLATGRTVFVDHTYAQFPEYNGEKVKGSFVDVLKPVAGSKIPGTQTEIKWVSNENVTSRKIYFSGITQDMEHFKVEIADLGSRGKGSDWWCEDSYMWTIPVVDVPYGTIEVEESIDNVTFISDESETFAVPRDIVFQSSTIPLGYTVNYQAYNTITAKNNFIIDGNGSEGGNVTMGAGETVYLQGEFQAKAGCEFHAFADPSIRWNPSTSTSLKTKPLVIAPTAKKDSTKTPVEIPSKETKESIPTVFTCAQNRPNPFVRSTTINYGLPKDSDVNLTVFNIAGQAVKTLVNANQSAGFRSVNWDGSNNAGVQMPQGIYFYVFRAGNFEAHKKMILLK